ncbi:MTH1187 family thiamine-binding protein [Patescibacteria group bacterium]|nr:MTH1187 family thiamine-binding protein [Patescibacteria group bacterium]
MTAERDKEQTMIIAEFAIFPTSEGASVSRFVKEAIRVIEDSGLKSVTGGMSTAIEAPDLESLFRVIGQADEALVKMGAKRIHVDLRIDHRLDKKATIESKLKAVGKS